MSHYKDFCILNYDIIGFDLDNTLLRFNINNMVPLYYDLLKKFLVFERNYPEQLLQLQFNPNFLLKGLIIDANCGNLLKVSEDGTILKAAHGTKFLSDQEIIDIYGLSRTCSNVQTFVKDPLAAWNEPIDKELRALMDYFDIGVSLVFAQTVDVLDRLSSGGDKLQKQHYKIWPDMLDGLMQIYTRENFANGQSGFFEALKSNPDKYLLKTDASVIKLLRELKACGKSLFLLSGSNIDFANFTASYALGNDWQDLFDYVITFAKKPKFFQEQRQFLKVENLSEISESTISLTELLTPKTNYTRGNWEQLKKSICEKVLHKNPKHVETLYVGDNILQDVYAPKVVSSMDCLVVLEELLENDNNYDFKTIIRSPLWGSYFSENGIPTLWSKLIEKYSKLCVSNMDVIAKVPIKDNIHCENKEGYFPQRPGSLK